MVKDKHISNALKMQYLVNALGGAAALHLKGLLQTDSDFQLAWTKLCSR